MDQGLTASGGTSSGWSQAPAALPPLAVPSCIGQHSSGTEIPDESSIMGPAGQEGKTISKGEEGRGVFIDNRTVRLLISHCISWASQTHCAAQGSSAAPQGMHRGWKPALGEWEIHKIHLSSMCSYRIYSQGLISVLSPGGCCSTSECWDRGLQSRAALCG